MKLKKIISFICLILIFKILLLSTGCWSRRELEDLAFVLAMGVDIEDDGSFKIIAQIGEDSEQQEGGGGGEEDGPTLMEGRGKTMSAAYDQLFSGAGKRPFLSHIRAIIISENLGENGINRIVDFLQRDIRIRSTTVIFIGRGDLQELMNIQPRLGEIPGLNLDEKIRFNWERSKIFRKELYEMVRDLKEGDIELVLPVLTPMEEKIFLGNAGYFQNTTLKGNLDNLQVLGLMFLMNDVRHGVITLKPKKEEARYLTLKLYGTHVSINPVDEDNRLVFYIDIEQELRVLDDETNLTTAQMEEEANNYIKFAVLDTVNIAKEKGIDFLGFGRRYRRKYPQRWDEDRWQRKFKDSEVIIRVNSNVNREIR